MFVCARVFAQSKVKKGWVSMRVCVCVERVRLSGSIESCAKANFPLYIYICECALCSYIRSPFYLTRLNIIIFIIDMYGVYVCYITKFIFISIEIWVYISSTFSSSFSYSYIFLHAATVLYVYCVIFILIHRHIYVYIPYTSG